MRAGFAPRGGITAAGRDTITGLCVIIGRTAAGRGAIACGRGAEEPFPNPFENPPPPGFIGFIFPMFAS
ncbi:MAG: hypothetical protein A2030_10470 [Chloroflexi bacterium RBG_19FT_COMBO_50_10]|nr:MAG: hypothetical protein A2030_10470 [Chloroflexi bacterium RBG_19FT_COMBO_50_10]